MIECFGTSRKNVGVESGIRISRLKTQFAVIRFESKHDGDRTNINIPRYDVNIFFSFIMSRCITPLIRHVGM